MATNQEFVTSLYEHALLRSPDSPGLAWYVEQLDTGSSTRADLLVEFANSVEFDDVPIKLATVYQTCLGRQPDMKGLQYWAGRFYSGTSLVQIANEMLSSPEFADNFPAAIKPKDVIEQMYHSGLGRDPDSGGFSFYRAEVGRGMSLGQVAVDIALSLEGRGHNYLAIQKTLLWHGAKGTKPSPLDIQGLPDIMPDMAVALTATTDPGVFWESSTILYGTAAVEAPLFLDLATKTLTLDGDYQGLSSGTFGNVQDIDFSKLTADPSKSLIINVKGDNQNNTYTASNIGDIFEGRSGNDIINLGAGQDTVIFSSTAINNGLDKINNFELGKDLLDLSKFLNKTLGTIRLVPVDKNTSTGVLWSSGDIIAVNGANLTTPGAIASLFGTVLANPTGPGTAVVISADVVGDACVWFVSNTGSGYTGVITPGEVQQVAELKGVNNLLDTGTLNSLKASAGVSLGLGELHYSGIEFEETLLNDGQVTPKTGSKITIEVYGDKFVGANGKPIGSVAKTPAGLTAKLIKITDTKAELELVGKAKDHTFADSISDLTVTFKGADFLSGQEPIGHERNDLSVTFYDVFAGESGGTLTVEGRVPNPLVINKASNTITSGGKPISLGGGGSLAAATTFDLSKIMPTSSTVEVIGSATSETFISAPHGATIRGGGGNDTIYAGDGVDRIVFDPVVSGTNHNGIDTIYNFKVGKGGDILDFSSFLGSPVLKSPELNTSSMISCYNRDVLVVQGTPAIHSPTSVAALFGTTYAFTGGYTKLVVITSDTTGSAHIWYVYDEDGSGSITTTGSNNEVTLVGILDEVSNLYYYPLDPTNIA